MSNTAEKIETQLRVRPFEDRDAEVFVELGRWLQSGGEYKDCGFNPNKVLLLFANVMKNPNYYGVLAEAYNGKVVGAFVAVAEPYYFSDELIARDICFGLLPGYRQDAQAVMFEMLDGFEEWAKKMGVFETWISTSAGMNGNRLEGFLNSIGYRSVGFNTKKRM